MRDKGSILLAMASVMAMTDPRGLYGGSPILSKFSTPKKTWRDTQSAEDKEARLKKAQEKRDRKMKKKLARAGF